MCRVMVVARKLELGGGGGFNDEQLVVMGILGLGPGGSGCGAKRPWVNDGDCCCVFVVGCWLLAGVLTVAWEVILVAQCWVPWETGGVGACAWSAICLGCCLGGFGLELEFL